jgi:membrane protein
VEERVQSLAAKRLGIGGVRAVAKDAVQAFEKHGLLTYGSAIAFRWLVSVVPLSLLALAVLGALGKSSVWTDDVAPVIHERVTPPVFHAIDYSAQRVLNHGTAGLIAFASALFVWDLAWSIRATMEALSAIHGVEERRSQRRRFVRSLMLAVACGGLVILAFLAVAAGGGIAEGAAGRAASVLRWPLAAALLVLALGLLVRHAPAEKPETRWASAGSIGIVAGWIVAALAFRWWAGNVADYRSAAGTLLGFLVLTTFILIEALVFLVGVQVDELLRQRRERDR